MTENLANPSPTRSQKLATEIEALIRAKETLIWITTKEEARTENYLIEASIRAKYTPRSWDCAAGIMNLTTRTIEPFSETRIDETLGIIDSRATKGPSDRGAWILRDAHEWTTGTIGIVTRRQLRNLARKLQTAETNRAQTIIILSPSTEIPPELSGHTTAIDWPLPDRTEIGTIYDDAISILPEASQAALGNGTREAAIDAAIGLTGEEAANCYTKSLITAKGLIVPKLISGEKKRIITRERVLEWHDPIPGGLDAVGGLGALKRWLLQRAGAYTKQAREYKLPFPRGVLLVGIPGCGKSLTAKAIATAWGVPLLRIDLGALQSKFVGESQQNLRKALKVIEAIGRTIVWIDEIEKSLAGAINGAADGGVSADQLGTLLSWMQERAGGAFLVATSNDVTKLPPELLRKGRFDEIFSVDVPNEIERSEILATALKEHGRDPDLIDRDAVAEQTVEFTGSEIANLVPDAMYAAFADGMREINTDDILAAAKTVVPLTRTAGEKISQFREWAKTRARPATEQNQQITDSFPRTRNLELN